ncbi:hypothetical protein [Nocardia sp. NPDC005745]|uniref:hypothetical protein n=1 Tax=Nocardia sp. NPDC005745 TaxID=3157061 RepID=UPI0033DA1C24
MPRDHRIDGGRAEQGEEAFGEVCREKDPVEGVDPGLAPEYGWKSEVTSGRDP